MFRKQRATKISLSSKIFQYLLGTIVLSLFLLGSFWIHNKFSRYKREVEHIKQTFSETKKTEIKHKILSIKDYINWVLHNPLTPLKQILPNKLNTLTLAAQSGNGLVSVIDSAKKTNLPVYIIDQNNKVIYNYHPFSSNKLQIYNDEKALLQQLSKVKTGTGFINRFARTTQTDSVLQSVIYYNSHILKKHTVATIVNASNFSQIIQAFILDSLSKIHYTRDEYVFVNTYNGLAHISNGKLNIPPVDIFKGTDTSWINIFKVEQLSALHAEGIFYSYHFKKVSDPKKVYKTSYFSYLPEWKWIIGTGFYEDDIDRIIEAKRKSLFTEMQADICAVSVLLLVAVFFSFLIVKFFEKRLKNNIGTFKDFFEKAAQENVVINKEQISYSEFEQLAEAANIMVAERIKTKGELRKSEEKFHKAFKNSPDAISISTLADGLIVEANNSLARMLGKPLSQITGRTFRELGCWHNNEDYTKFVASITELGRAENFETNFRVDNNDIRNCLLSGEIIHLGNEKFLLSIIRDITDRKNAEILLRNSEERYRLLFEHNPAPMFIYEVNTLRFLAVNEAFCEIYGYTANEIKTMHLPDLYPNDEKAPIVALAKTLRGHAYAGEWHHIKKNGTTIAILSTSHDLVYLGLNARIAVVTDITDRKKAEQELLASKEKAEESDRLKTAFLHNISHEIRTPMNAIVGFSGFLNDPNLSPDKREMFVDIIIQSSNQLLSIITDIVNIATIEAGQEKLFVRETNLNTIVKLLYEQFRVKAQQNNIMLNYKISLSDTDATILTDQTKFTETLTNLLENAFKFTQKGHINFGYVQKGQYLEFFVEDTGIGIPYELQSEIFKRFRQVETGSIRKFGGSGLGLSLSKAYIDLMGGKIWVESDPNKGSTFYFTIPYNKHTTT